MITRTDIISCFGKVVFTVTAAVSRRSSAPPDEKGRSLSDMEAFHF